MLFSYHGRLDKIQSESIDLDTLKGFITSPQQRETSLNNTQNLGKNGRDDIFISEILPVSNLDLDLKQLTVAGRSVNNITGHSILCSSYSCGQYIDHCTVQISFCGMD